MAKFEKGNKVKIVNTGTVWDDKLGTVIKEAEEDIYTEEGDDLTEVLVKVAFKSNDEVKSIIQTFNRGNLELVPEENLNEEKSKMNTKLVEEVIDPKNDIIKDYVQFEDIDGNVVPGWIFIDKIINAEGVDDVTVLQCAKDHGYKVFVIESGEYYRTVIANKKIKKEDIATEFADFLLGSARVEEVK